MIATRKILLLATLPLTAGAGLYLNWEKARQTVDQTVHQSTLIEINEKGDVKIIEPLTLPQLSELETARKPPKSLERAQNSVRDYNERHKKTVSELEKILEENDMKDSSPGL